MTATIIVFIVCIVFFLLELVILSMASKNPLHIHGNRKVLLTLFIKKDKYLSFKEAAQAHGYSKIEPYIEELIDKDISNMKNK